MSRENEFVEKNKSFAVNMAFALMLWLFGVMVFLPLFEMYVSPELYRVMALGLLVLFSVYFYRAAINSGPLIEYFSSKISSWIIDWQGVDEGERPDVWRRTLKIVKITLTLVSYLVFRPILWAAHPVFAGFALIITIILMITIL